MFRVGVWLCEFLLKCSSFFMLILVLLFKCSDFILLSYNILTICSIGEAFSAIDVSYFACLWLLRFASFCFILCYVIVDVHRIEEENKNYLKYFLVFQSIFLIKSLINITVCVWINDNDRTISQEEDGWLLSINSYSLVFFYFVQTNRPILMGYLIQLGFEVFVFAIIYLQFTKFRSEDNFYCHRKVEMAIAIIGVDLVKF